MQLGVFLKYIEVVLINFALFNSSERPQDLVLNILIYIGLKLD